MDECQGAAVDEYYTQLVFCHYKQVLAYARRLSPLKVSDANDITQEAFQRLYIELKNHPEKKLLKPLAWLYTVAKNAHSNMLRTEARTTSISLQQVRPGERETQDTEPLHALVAINSSPDEVAIGNELLQQVTEAILQLPAGNVRETTQMRVLEELSYQEISEHTGRPVGSGKAYAHRGIGALRVRLSSWRDKGN